MRRYGLWLTSVVVLLWSMQAGEVAAQTQWAFVFVHLDYETNPAGEPDWTNYGTQFAVNFDGCEDQRIASSKAEDWMERPAVAVSDQCYEYTWGSASSGALQLRLALTPPPAAITVNAQCAYAAAVRLVDPLFPTTGLTGAKKKAMQAKRITTRRAVVAEIHAGLLGDQARWDVLCPPK